MTGPNKKLIAAAEAYFAHLRQVRASGGGTEERSYYPAVEGLLRTVGQTLKPKVFCVLEAANQGVGHPDFALYTANQIQRGRPTAGQVPERGVVEVKRADDDAWLTVDTDQVSPLLGPLTSWSWSQTSATSFWWARTPRVDRPNSKP